MQYDDWIDSFRFYEDIQNKLLLSTYFKVSKYVDMYNLKKKNPPFSVF